MKHHLHPLRQACTQCGADASDIENGCIAAGRRTKRRHYILIDNDGTREIFAPPGVGPRE